MIFYLTDNLMLSNLFCFAHLQMQRCYKIMQIDQKMQKMPSEYTCSQLFFCTSVHSNKITASSDNYFGVLIDRFGLLRISVVMLFCVPDLP
jgi:hypothetical protein